MRVGPEKNVTSYLRKDDPGHWITGEFSGKDCLATYFENVMVMEWTEKTLGIGSQAKMMRTEREHRERSFWSHFRGRVNRTAR